MNKKIRIGALFSGGGSNLQAIIDACESGKTDGDVIFAGSDNPDACGLERCKQHNIPSFVVDYADIIQKFRTQPGNVNIPADFDLNEIVSKQSLFSKNADAEKVSAFMTTRAIAEAALIEKMQAYSFDLLVLAGFMRTLTPYFIDRINTDHPRIMNIHPALLPMFPGVDGYGDTFRYGCKVGGCTVHFIDYGEDSGPIIGQKVFQIQESDTLDIVRQKGLRLEWQLYPECIQLFAQGRLKTMKRAYTLDNGNTTERTIVKVLPKV